MARHPLTGMARYLRIHATEEERLLWWWLKDAFDVRWRRQVPIGRYIVDFAGFGPRLIIEVDGVQHSWSTTDQARDQWLRRQGFTVLRFWNADVRFRIEDVLDTIGSALNDPDRGSTAVPRRQGGSD